MYIFDLQKFIKSSIEDCDTPNFIRDNVINWAMKIDGKPVDMTKELIGFCNGFTVSSRWCREVDHVMKFSKELYLQKSEFCDDWCNLIDGEIVEFKKKNDTYGICKDFIILKDWCEELEL